MFIMKLGYSPTSRSLPKMKNTLESANVPHKIEDGKDCTFIEIELGIKEVRGLLKALGIELGPIIEMKGVKLVTKKADLFLTFKRNVVIFHDGSRCNIKTGKMLVKGDSPIGIDIPLENKVKQNNQDGQLGKKLESVWRKALVLLGLDKNQK